MLQKFNKGTAVLLVSLLSMIGTAHAALPTGATTAFSDMSDDFTELFGLAFTALVIITVAMIAWRYTRKLGNKL